MSRERGERARGENEGEDECRSEGEDESVRSRKSAGEKARTSASAEHQDEVEDVHGQAQQQTWDNGGGRKE